ncbi:hypothetical protein HK099_004405 [Clydaea vesicula]|uniref:Uncharacterized protein n=1 Tax=Clydaea vesicula TaxID=447962 RepID=A0AAD5U547_9FUNG|nr:hypothetical protein HK099_004405 [Clydaea vesicula]
MEAEKGVTPLAPSPPSIYGCLLGLEIETRQPSPSLRTLYWQRGMAPESQLLGDEKFLWQEGKVPFEFSIV